MKRLLSLLGVGIVVLVLLAGIVMFNTFRGLRSLEPRLLAGLGDVVVDGYVSATLLDVGEGQFALIDCGNDTEARAILEVLARHSGTADNVTAIFLTHGHPDHAKGCAKFPRATIYGAEVEQPFLAGERAYPGPLPRLFGKTNAGVRITRPLTDTESVRIGRLEVTAYATPGHTPGSFSYLVDGVLFLGDNADINDDGTLRPAAWVFSDDTQANRASLTRLSTLLRHGTLRGLVPAHSGSVDSGEALLSWH